MTERKRSFITETDLFQADNQNFTSLSKSYRKIIVLEAPDDVLMKRLEDGDNFNDAVETIPKRIKTYRCASDMSVNQGFKALDKLPIKAQ